MLDLVIDLETIRCPKSAPFIPEKGPRDKVDPAEKVAFDPNYNQICVAGFCFDGKTWSMGLNAYSGHENPEAALLRFIWSEIALYERIVTFNGHSYDLPLLMRRSWYHGVHPSKHIDMNKYHIGNHIDVRMILSNFDNYARGNLDLYASLKLGRGKTEGMDGSKVQAAWDAGEYDKVRFYCEEDCLITWDLYQSLKGYYLPSEPEDEVPF